MATPIKFPEQTHVIAEDQPEYQPLPAFINHQQMITCWSLNWKERLKLLFTGKVWLRILRNPNTLVEPQLIEINKPFVKDNK